MQPGRDLPLLHFSVIGLVFGRHVSGNLTPELPAHSPRLKGPCLALCVIAKGFADSLQILIQDVVILSVKSLFAAIQGILALQRFDLLQSLQSDLLCLCHGVIKAQPVCILEDVHLHSCRRHGRTSDSIASLLDLLHPRIADLRRVEPDAGSD